MTANPEPSNRLRCEDNVSLMQASVESPPRSEPTGQAERLRPVKVFDDTGSNS